MYTSDEEVYLQKYMNIAKAQQGFEEFKHKNPTYLNTLNGKITHLYTLYNHLNYKRFYKIENDPQLYETARYLGYGMLMRHALELISIDVCLKNGIDIGGKSVYERLSTLRGQILPGYDSKTEAILSAVLNATNVVAHPHITTPNGSFDALENLYTMQFKAVVENQIGQTKKKPIKKYLKALQKELNAFDLRRTYPRLLILGCLMRQLTECVVNLWCFNLGLLPTDAPLVDDYIDLRTALLNLQYVAENNTQTAFGKSSLTTDVINTLFELKNTSNAFMHVDAEAIDIASLKKHGEALNGLAAKITNQCSPYALELKLDSSKQDGPAVKVTLLCGLFGWLGVHHFYAKNIFRGILFLLTFGLGGLGTLYNLNQLRSGAFFSQKWGTLAKTRWSTVLAVLFMALHIYLIGLLLFPS